MGYYICRLCVRGNSACLLLEMLHVRTLPCLFVCLWERCPSVSLTVCQSLGVLSVCCLYAVCKQSLSVCLSKRIACSCVGTQPVGL
jgi:hypothetical protein